LFLWTRAETLAGSANRASPLVRREQGLSAGIGLSYTIARSSEPGAP
jgi:outer membrane scaffolding protein for murein synthesis (MipA/OmpV family)